MTTRSRKKPTLQYRSKLEADLASGVLRGVAYEPLKLQYPKATGTYTPDFILENGTVLEVKGFFTPSDRTKMLAVRKANPGIEIRFVFQAPGNRLSKTSRTTYAQWAAKHEFWWCDAKDTATLKAWIAEPTNHDSRTAIAWRPIP